MSKNIRTGLEDSAGVVASALMTSGQTLQFFMGRSFRMYREFTGAAVIRIVATKPFMLTSQSLYVVEGTARAVVSLGGTPGGTFVALPTVFNKNGVTVPTAPQDLVLTHNGTVTGGAEREVLRGAAGAGGLLGGQGAGSGSGAATWRLLPAGTYFISITVTGTTSGIYSIEWDELDS